MKRIAAQYLYAGSGRLLPKQVLSFDADGVLQSIESLVEETAETLFLNGILVQAFSLPGSTQPLSPEEATQWLKSIRREVSGLTVMNFFERYVVVPLLTVGTKPSFWCVEPVDFKNALVLDATIVYGVFP